MLGPETYLKTPKKISRCVLLVVRHGLRPTNRQRLFLALGLEAFGVDSLRPHQREALRLLFAGESVAQCVRTGGGKSLVPMLWAWLRRYHPRLFPGRSSVLVAFFPTNVLKRDMERRARAGGLSVFASPSYGDNASHDDPPTRPQPRCEATLRELPSADFIVLTVEFFFGSSSRAASLAWFLKEQSQRSRVFFWVDEADAAIVSSRTYRPSQKQLGELSALHPTAQLLLSSATLSPEMMRAASSFYCSGASTFRIVRSEIDRPNLHFSVMRDAATKVDAYDGVFCELCHLYRLRSQGGEWAGAQAIVFVLSRNDTAKAVEHYRRKCREAFSGDNRVSVRYANFVLCGPQPVWAPAQRGPGLLYGRTPVIN